MSAPPPARAWSFRPVERFWRHYYGFEFFLSYPHADGRRYARDLHRALTTEHGFRVFRDKEELQAGQGLTPAIQRSLRRAFVLVVLHTPEADDSEWVAKEVTLFAATGRRIVAVDLRAPGSRTADGALSPLGRALGERLYVEEEPNAIERGPSEAAVRAIAASFEGLRVEARRVTMLTAVALFLLASTVLSIFLALSERAAKEDARREAAAARRETANRLAVQSLEKLDGDPLAALQLAIDGLAGPLAHGDPAAPRAISAFHRAFAALAGSRPLAPETETEAEAEERELILGPYLRRVVALGEGGEVRFGTAGARSLAPLPPPAGVLEPNERWAARAAVAAFAHDASYLAVLRWIQPEGEPRASRAVLTLRELDPTGMSDTVGAPRFVQPLDASPFGPATIELSFDGRWIAVGVDEDAWLRTTEAVPAVAPIEIADAVPGSLRFAPDSERAFVDTDREGLRRFRLGPGSHNPFVRGERHDASDDDGPPVAEELPPVSLGWPDRVAYDVSKSGRRLALLRVSGEAEWWELDASPPVRHELPFLLDAYEEPLRLYSFGDSLEVTLEINVEDELLLACISEHEHADFGLAAVCKLEEGAAWSPLVHHYAGMERASIARTKGNAFGANSGYDVKNRYELGVRSARAFPGAAVITLGHDGSLLFWRTDPPREQRFDSGAASFLFEFWGEGILIGARGGRARMIDTDDKTLYRLNGHAAPVVGLRYAPYTARVATTSAAGETRVWRLRHPSRHVEDIVRTSPDLRWIATRSGWHLSLWNSDPRADFAALVAGGREGDLSAVAFDEGGGWAVTHHGNPWSDDPATLRLWDLTREAPWDEAVLQREFARVDHPDLSSGSAPWMALAEADGRVWLAFRGRGFGEHESGALPLDPSQPGAEIVPRDAPEVPAELQPSTPPPLRGESRWATRRASPDGHWHVEDSVARSLIYPEHDGPAFEVSLERGFGLGRGRSPLWIDSDGDLHRIARDGGALASHPVRRGDDLSAAGWDDAGRWLALGDAEGRVRLLDLGDVALRAETAEQQLAGGELLPPPAEEVELGSVRHLSIEDDAAYVGASTSGSLSGTGFVLLWRRRDDGGFDEPLVLWDEDLGLGYVDELRLLDSGRRLGVLAGAKARVLPLDPEDLLDAASGPAGIH